MKYALPAVALVLCFPAAALADNETGFYVGAGVGYFNAKIDNVEDVLSAVDNFDAHDTSLRIFGGWRFSRFIALDLAYIDFGGPDDEVAGQQVKAEIDGFAPAVYGTLPLGPLELFAKAGYLFYDLNVDINGQEVASRSGSDEDFIYGAGLGITLFERLNARLEYERVEVSEADRTDAVWLTGAWRF